MSEEDQLADTYTPSDRAGTANQRGGRYHRHQKFASDPISQDSLLSIKHSQYDSVKSAALRLFCQYHLTNIENGIEMYGLFCGFSNGGPVADFARNRMAFEIFGDPDPIRKDMDPELLTDLLRNKFLSVTKRYEQELEDYLSQILILKLESENPDMIKIKELQAKVRAGCTALVILRIFDVLYVLNCGTAQALIFTDENQVTSLFECVHDKDNPAEQERLKALNVNPDEIIGPTRAIGDGFRSIRYEEEPEFLKAKGPPVIRDPDVFTVKIQPGWRHLLMVSPGMIQNVKDCEGGEDPATEILYLFQEVHSLSGTASTVVFKVEMKHKDAYDQYVAKDGYHSNHREEMSVIYVKLLDSPSIINTIDSSINSTIASLSQEPETVDPYVDLSPTRASQITKDLEKYLSVPPSTS